MNTPTDAFIGLGSNVGDRAAQFESALDMLRAHARIEVLAVSAFLETEPWGPVKQARYLNAAAHLRTTLSARQLLASLLAIECAHGRERPDHQRWGPRSLDLDLLLFGALSNEWADLVVPHPRMHERLFVLEPLAAIAPDAVHPVLGVTIDALLRQRKTCSQAGSLDV